MGGGERGATQDRQVAAILDGAPDAVVAVDADGCVIRWNARAQELFGRPAADALGRPAVELLVPEDRRAAYGAGLARIIRNGDSPAMGRAVEVEALHADGTAVPVELTLSRLEAGDEPTVVAFLRDIRERRAAQAALRESERRLSEAQALAQVGSFELDLADGVVRWSDELCRIFGVERDQAPTDVDGYFAMVHPDDHDLLRAGMARALAGEATEDEYRVVRGDGKLRWIHGRRRAVLGPDGTAVAMAGTVQDITERRRQEQELQAARSRFEQAFRDAPIGIALVGLDGRFVQVNDALCAMVGFTREELLSRSFQDVSHPDELEADLAELRVLLGGGDGPYRGQRRYRRADGSIVWMDLAVSLLRDEDGRPTYFIAHVEDVTERRRAQQELLRSNAELEQFAHVASHDLQEPLRTVRGFTDLLVHRHGDALPDDARRYLDAVAGGVTRMQELLRSLLQYARAGDGEPRFADADLAALASDVVADLQATIAERRATVTVGDLPTVTGDPALLRQVLHNLVANALKFTPPDRAPEVAVTARRRGAGWLVSVADRGIGIPPEMAERVFGLFQRLHTQEEFEGTGMGLALCKKVVDRHGGGIWIEPTPGGGTTVSFTLPDR